jgi:hypothetical protein
MMRHTLLVMGVLAVTCSAEDGQSPQFTPDGQLIRPTDYREWVFLTSGLGMTYGPMSAQMSRSPFFDNVFVNPAAYRAFKETGHWPDKTIFILEIRSSAGKSSINKAGHFQTDIAGIEAEVKDESRFPGKWGFFGFGGPPGDPAKTAKLIPQTASCYSCHSKHGAVENTFAQFYPTALEIAEHKGTTNKGFEKPSPTLTQLYHVVNTEGWPPAEHALAETAAKEPEAPVLEEGTLNRLGYALLGAKNTTGAIEVFKWNAGRNPASANAFDSLAEAYEAAGQKDAAAKSAQKVLALLDTDSGLTDDQRKALREAAVKRTAEQKR